MQAIFLTEKQDKESQRTLSTSKDAESVDTEQEKETKEKKI